MRSFTWLSPGWALGHVRSWSQRFRQSLLTRQSGDPVDTGRRGALGPWAPDLPGQHGR